MKRKISAVYLSWPKPVWAKTVKTNKNFKNNFHAALLYAHYELSALDLFKETIKYLTARDPKDPMIERVRVMNENRFVTFGKYFYILNHGGDLPDEISGKLWESFEKILSDEEEKVAAIEKSLRFKSLEENKVQKPVIAVPSIQDKIIDKSREVAGEIEGWFDDWTVDRKTPIKTVEEYVSLFKASELKSPHISYLKSCFQRRANEFEEVVKGNNPSLIEGYSNFTKPEMKKLVMMMRNLYLACDMIQEVAKVIRAPRKKKPVSIDKIVSKLKYKKEDPALGIVSLNPVNIPGAKEVWFYNTKTRKLGVYKAKDVTGLSVKGTGLLNFSPDSVEKTVRKPVEVLADFKKASKVKLRTFLSDLTTVDVPCQGKLNEHYIILRIDK